MTFCPANSLPFLSSLCSSKDGGASRYIGVFYTREKAALAYSFARGLLAGTSSGASYASFERIRHLTLRTLDKITSGLTPLSEDENITGVNANASGTYRARVYSRFGKVVLGMVLKLLLELTVTSRLLLILCSFSQSKDKKSNVSERLIPRQKQL